ncbi:MAG TPA: ABC transporter ATP-binding protein [Castellaniella sp.]|uniref:ABC transporter ATP-binding protein n=1 Tax=Castellaniella sp. TaxID=1955812 RepID=UPI002EF84CA0
MDIQIEGLVKTYVSEGRTVRALDGIDLHIPANQIFTLLGPSGCGKTTLLRCIVGLETPDDGEIRIGGEVVWSRSKRVAVPPEKRGLGMVFQTYAIWPHMSVFDNVAYPLQVRGVARAAIREKVLQVLKHVQLDGLEGRSATRLSGGQQQRVALARALVAEPKVILFDEPLSNLDAKLREETRKLLRHFLTELGITAVYVTHDRVEALALSDSIAVLNGGHIIERGDPQKIYFSADHRFVADFIGRANLIPATVHEQQPDWTVVRTPWGLVSCQKRDFAPGSQVTLCIRPEFLHLTARPEGSAPSSTEETGVRNVVEGRVEALDFVGEVYEAEVRVDDQVLLARVDPTLAVGKGDMVHFALAPEHCLLVTA